MNVHLNEYIIRPERYFLALLLQIILNVLLYVLVYNFILKCFYILPFFISFNLVEFIFKSIVEYIYSKLSTQRVVCSLQNMFTFVETPR